MKQIFALMCTAVLFSGCDSSKVTGTAPYVDQRTPCATCEQIGDFQRWAWDHYGTAPTFIEPPTEVQEAADGPTMAKLLNFTPIGWDGQGVNAEHQDLWNDYCAGSITLWGGWTCYEFFGVIYCKSGPACKTVEFSDPS